MGVVSYLSGGGDSNPPHGLTPRFVEPRIVVPTWQTVYASGFEAPTYAAANLHGQDNWIVDNGDVVVGSTTPALDEAMWAIATNSGGASHPFPDVAGFPVRAAISFYMVGNAGEGGYGDVYIANYGALDVYVGSDGFIYVNSIPIAETWTTARRFDVTWTLSADRTTMVVTVGGVEVYSGPSIGSGEPDFISFQSGSAFPVHLDSVVIQVLR